MLLLSFSAAATVLLMTTGQAAHPPRNHRWALVIVMVLLGGLAGAQWLRRGTSPANRNLPPVVREGAGIEPLSLKLLASPHISRAWGLNPHGGPTFGEDNYVYSGRIEIDGKPFKVRLEIYEPIAAVRFQNETYLLVRAYFWKAYGLRRLDKDGKLAEVPPTALDRSFGLMKFVDPLECYYYRIWWLTALAKADRAADVVKYFNEYVVDDPRWVFPDGKEGIGLEEFLERIWEKREYRGIVESLQAIVEHSNTTDSEQIFRAVCLALIYLNPDDGTYFVRDFERRIRTQEVTGGDSRLVAFKMLRKLLDEPTSRSSPTTQPTSSPARPVTPPLPPRRP